MVALKVSEFDPADALTGAEVFGVVQGGENRQTPLDDITTFVAADIVGGAATTELIRDTIAAALLAATGVNGGVVITVNDPGDTITIGLLSSAFFTLTDAATIAWNMNDGYNAKVTLGGNRAIGTPTNPVEGRTYTLQIIQDGTGSRTITDWGVIDFGDAGDPTLSTAAGSKDFVYLQCIESAGPTFRATFNKA